MSIMSKLVEAFSPPKPMISVAELHQHLNKDDDILLLDVRTPADYHGEQGHIKQSTLIPVEELAQRTQEIAAYKNKKVVTICRTDRKSTKAQKILNKQGFTNVQIAKMGMTDWLKHHYPAEK